MICQASITILKHPIILISKNFWTAAALTAAAAATSVVVAGKQKSNYN